MTERQKLAAPVDGVISVEAVGETANSAGTLIDHATIASTVVALEGFVVVIRKEEGAATDEPPFLGEGDDIAEVALMISKG